VTAGAILNFCGSMICLEVLMDSLFDVISSPSGELYGAPL
jgi:hypothetical protein